MEPQVESSSKDKKASSAEQTRKMVSKCLFPGPLNVLPKDASYALKPEPSHVGTVGKQRITQLTTLNFQS